MMRFFLTTAFCLAFVGLARAEKYTVTLPQGKEIVVHTSRAPVIVHRVLPPYGLKINWYQGELGKAVELSKEGKLPPVASEHSSRLVGKGIHY